MLGLSRVVEPDEPGTYIGIIEDGAEAATDKKRARGRRSISVSALRFSDGTDVKNVTVLRALATTECDRRTHVSVIKQDDSAGTLH